MKFRNRVATASNNTNCALHAEALEERQMLSAVDIFAAGVTGVETFDLKINNAVVASYTAGGDVEARDFEVFSYETDNDIDVRDIKIEFTNDDVSKDGLVDRNLYVDKIIVDGVAYQTENSRTWASAFNNNGVVESGRFQTEALNVNGGFRYSELGASQTRIRIDASGSTGVETMRLLIDGEVVKEFSVSDDLDAYYFVSDKVVTPDQVRIEFTNDFYDPANDIDRNLQVKKVQLIDTVTGDRIKMKPTDSDVLSTGTWVGTGVEAGFGRGDTLHINGYFQFGATEQGRSQEDVLAEFESRYAGFNSAFFTSGLDISGTGRLSPTNFVDGQGRKYLVGGATVGGEDILIVRLLSDGSVDPTFGENGLSVTNLEEYVFPATEVTIANWERNGSVGPRPVTQTARASAGSARLAFDSNGQIAVVMNVSTGDNSNTPGSRINRTKWLGNQVIRLNADGSADTSFSDDGSHIVEYVEGITVRTLGADFDANDQLLVIGQNVNPITTVILGNLSGVDSEVKTLQLVEPTPGEFELVDITNSGNDAAE